MERIIRINHQLVFRQTTLTLIVLTMRLPRKLSSLLLFLEKYILDEALIQIKLYLRMKVTFLFSNCQSSLRPAQRSYHGPLMDYLSGESIQSSKRATRWHNKEILLKGKWQLVRKKRILIAVGRVGSNCSRHDRRRIRARESNPFNLANIRTKTLDLGKVYRRPLLFPDNRLPRSWGAGSGPSQIYFTFCRNAQEIHLSDEQVWL